MSSLLNTQELIDSHTQRREQGYENDAREIRELTKVYRQNAQHKYGNSLVVEGDVADAIGSGTWSQCMNVSITQRVGDEKIVTERNCPVVYYIDRQIGNVRKAGMIMPDGSIHELKGMYRTNTGITSFNKLSPESEADPNGEKQGLLPDEAHATLRRVPDLTVDFMNPSMSGGEEVNRVLSMDVVIKPVYIRHQYDSRLQDEDIQRTKGIALSLKEQLQESE